jgi:hypothetical protein
MDRRAICQTVPFLSVAVLLLVLAPGCALTPNFFRETGPATRFPLESPTAFDIETRYEPSPIRHRNWPESTVLVKSGAVRHYPLYFEDPFEDKGHGRTEKTHPLNVYHFGWEDAVAAPYGLARFTANWLLLPISVVVTPPWTVMESDGRVSKQILTCDHDAKPLSPWPGFKVPPPQDEYPAGRASGWEPAPRPDTLPATKTPAPTTTESSQPSPPTDNDTQPPPPDEQPAPADESPAEDTA